MQDYGDLDLIHQHYLRSAWPENLDLSGFSREEIAEIVQAMFSDGLRNNQ